MARIVIADDGIEFDGKTPEQRALGGVESTIVSMSEELASRGHKVLVRNMCKAPLVYKGVDWAPLKNGLPDTADLYIANRGDKLINLLPKAKRTLFWTHNPAGYTVKWRYISKLWWRKPLFGFIGEYHAKTLPKWVPEGGRVIIPYGIPDAFRTAEPTKETPPPRAVFTSNPLRSLDWLLELWAERIQPNVPGAELHIFSGHQTYGSVGDDKAQAMKTVLDRAEELKDQGVILRGPVPKAQLIDELRAARAMLYRSDLNETFCLALGEAQAMGVPCVTQDFGSAYERVIDGETGTVAPDDDTFVKAAIDLLKNDDLWHKQHLAALDNQRKWSWAEAAQLVEGIIPQ
ncbi:MAG: glycosyltransferase family 4 protein [Rhodospirillales bacterium]|nr:glycosyltransferase family 4 protein [Rhodospirillales bacterium]